jgi:hypothetical protein
MPIPKSNRLYAGDSIGHFASDTLATTALIVPVAMACAIASAGEEHQ